MSNGYNARIVYIQPLTELEVKISVLIVTEFTKITIDFEKISKSFLHDRINILIQNDKIINRLNRNIDSSRIADNDLKFIH